VNFKTRIKPFDLAADFDSVRNVGLRIGDAPLSNYRDTAVRNEARRALFKDREWLAFPNNSTGAVVEENNIILIGTEVGAP